MSAAGAGNGDGLDFILAIPRVRHYVILLSQNLAFAVVTECRHLARRRAAVDEIGASVDSPLPESQQLAFPTVLVMLQSVVDRVALPTIGSQQGGSSQTERRPLQQHPWTAGSWSPLTVVRLQDGMSASGLSKAYNDPLDAVMAVSLSITDFPVSSLLAADLLSREGPGARDALVQQIVESPPLVAAWIQHFYPTHRVWDYYLFAWALGAGNWWLARFITTHHRERVVAQSDPSVYTEGLLDKIAVAGNLPALRYFLGLGLRGLTSFAITYAAEYGYLDMVQWLHQNRSEAAASMTAIDEAAGNGHLDIVRYLHENGGSTFDCSTSAMDRAASRGHLDIVRFLHENRNEGCTGRALDAAARHGHLDVIKFLHANRKADCWGKSRLALENAMLSGHDDIVAFLRSKKYKPAVPSTLLGGAIDKRNMDLVKKICNDPELLASHDLRLLFQSAIHTRDVELVRYLYDKLVDTKENDGGPWCELVPIDCDMAVFCGDRPTLDFIVEKIHQGRVTGSPPFTKNVFEIAIGGARSCMIDPRYSNKETNKQIDAIQEGLRIVSRLAPELEVPEAALNALQVVLDEKLKGEMRALLERHKSKAGLDVADRLETLTTGDPPTAGSGPAEAVGGGGGDAMIGEQIAETEEESDDDDGDDSGDSDEKGFVVSHRTYTDLLASIHSSKKRRL
ncbi:hypothetical protein HK405_006452 [Cladochytrium tenue]|nr:hypothetical protein HK405_006452 [Cladochytrium tenue]